MSFLRETNVYKLKKSKAQRKLVSPLFVDSFATGPDDFGTSSRLRSRIHSRGMKTREKGENRERKSVRSFVYVRDVNMSRVIRWPAIKWWV